MILLPSSEPLFARGEQRKGQAVIYFDQEGYPACTNVAVRPNGRICVICHNMCIGFVANEDGSYTCSACGKFPREMILT
jgi:hypothetical protein